MIKQVITVAFGVMALGSVQLTAHAASVDAGRDAFETCRGCHSTPGYSNAYPNYYVPKVGGQVEAYTISALTAYKGSKRAHRPMMANSYDLSEQKIEDIAAFLAQAGDGSPLSNSNGGDIVKGEQLAETCKGCHNDAATPGSVNPRLAGQHANYLEKAIKDYQSEKRENALMKSMVEGLSKEDIKNVSAYFSSLKGGLTSVK